MFSLPWSGASLRLKLLLCYHLYTYTIQNVYLALLIYTAWSFDSRGISPAKLLEFLSMNTQGVWLWTLVLAELTLIWLVQFLLRIFLGRRAGVSTKRFFENVLLSTALHSFACLSVDISVFRGLVGYKMEFVPTNAFKTANPKQPLLYAKDLLFWFVTGMLVLLGTVLRNPLLFFGLNGLWIFFWVLTPFTLLLFHRDQLK